ncbi:MAG: type transport system ATP-binding protein [Chloroflexota bacterium]|jgi:ABC-2 type transport system ATP-binding protein|nr:type transport system ATP-binding protein [Chloroflexota bacterium]
MTQPPTETAVALRAAGLGRRFGDRWAVRDIDLEVQRGEVLGLLGPNGAGKTTTVRLLTALIEPTEGTAAVDGFDVRTQPDDVRARVGILTETPGLYDKLSARTNLDFFGRLYGLDAETRAQRIEHHLRLFGLWERRDEVTGTFSKGMKQKLAIARALLHDPSVVFLDEPTAALDPEAAFIVRESIETLRKAGRTIVLATHNLDEADRLCDRIAFVRAGLVRVDSPAALRGALGKRSLAIRLASSPSPDAIAALRQLDGIGVVEAVDGVLRVSATDPESIAPAVVRSLVAAGGDIVEVRIDRTSLEQIYFDVMGVRPGADGIEAPP